MFGQPTNPDFTAAEALTLAILYLHPVALRKWGMIVTVTNDPTPGNNISWLLMYNESSTDKADNDNWVDARTVYGSDLSAILSGTTDRQLLFNDNDSIGGFGQWDGSNLIIPANIVSENSFDGFILRESAANPYNRGQLCNWAFYDVAGTSGQVDRNIFLSDTIQDAVVTIVIYANGVALDGSEGISKVISASFRKDGTADPVQIGANTDLVSKEDSGVGPPTVTISLGNVGTDNIRVSYSTGSGASYTWNFFAIITYVKV